MCIVSEGDNDIFFISLAVELLFNFYVTFKLCFVAIRIAASIDQLEKPLRTFDP